MDHMGIQSYMGQGYEGEASGMRIATTRYPRHYVMAKLSRARVVRVLCVYMAAPCCWAARVCIGDVSECARQRLTPTGRASTKRFLFLMMPKKRD